MDQTRPPDSFCIPVSKNVHDAPVEDSSLPPHAILLDTVRSLERRLQERGLLRLPALQHPLWFLAEQERNHFLWRKGLSLADAARFDFWIDLPKLVSRRLEQLRRAAPIHLGGEMSVAEQPEQRYFEGLLLAIKTIEKHLSALSRAVCIMRLELESPREIILLPYP